MTVVIIIMHGINIYEEKKEDLTCSDERVGGVDKD